MTAEDVAAVGDFESRSHYTTAVIVFQSTELRAFLGMGRAGEFESNDG